MQAKQTGIVKYSSEAMVGWVEPMWERQPGETAIWHERFTIYLMLGLTRSFRAAFHQYVRVKENTPEKTFKPGERDPPNSWKNAAAIWKWKERCAEFDAAQSRKALASHERDVQAMMKRHQDGARAWQEAGLKALLEDDGQTIRKINDLPTAIRAWATGVEVERKASGLPSMVLELYALSDIDLQRRREQLVARIRASGRDPEATAGEADADEEDL